MSVRHPRPWKWEEHELSEGMSCIVYDARGHRVGGFEHLDRETAAEVYDRPRATSAALNAPVRSKERAALDVAVAALRKHTALVVYSDPEALIAEAQGRVDHASDTLDRIATILGEGETTP